MTSLTLLLALRGDAMGLSQVAVQAAAVAGPLLLGIAAWLTLWSLVLYFKGLWKYLG